MRYRPLARLFDRGDRQNRSRRLRAAAAAAGSVLEQLESRLLLSHGTGGAVTRGYPLGRVAHAHATHAHVTHMHSRKHGDGGDSGDGQGSGDGNGDNGDQGNSGNGNGDESGNHHHHHGPQPPAGNSGGQVSGSQSQPGPTATIAAPDITSPGGLAEIITVLYGDPIAVNAATISPANLTVTGPGGPLTVTAASANGPTASVLTATYAVAAPHGTWSNADNGSYTVALKAGQVADINGNLAGGASGSFTINIPSPVVTGPPDQTFAGGQTVPTSFATEAVATQPDGKILAVGHEGNLATGNSQGVIERFNTDGSLDTSFGFRGSVVTSASANEAFYAVTIQDSNHLIVAGTKGGDFLLARYSLNGRIDASFGAGGVTTTDFGTPSDTARGVAIAPGGTIVAAGESGGNFAFARYLSNGHLDTSFAQNGRQLFGLGAGKNGLGALAVQSDGKVVAAGAQGTNVIVVRLTATGEADGSFGHGGLVTVSGLTARLDATTVDRSEGLALDANGGILVANHTAAGHFGLVRLKANGVADASFGIGGIATANFGGDDDADAITVQPTGQIIVFGTSLQNGSAKTAVAAFDANGKPVSSFGTSGQVAVATGVALTGRELHVGDIVLRAFGTRTPDGRVIIGTTDQAVGATTSSSLRRLIVPGAVLPPDGVNGRLLGSFGVVNGKPTPLTVTAADGTRVTFSLAGGSGMAWESGSRFTIALDDMGRGLVFGISGRSAHHIQLGDVSVSGTLRAMSARGADLNGLLRTTGAMGSLSLGNVSGTIWSGDSIANVVAGDLSGSLFATAAIGRVRLGKVSGTIASGSGVIGSVFASTLASARILSGANLGADGMIGGTGANADSYGAGAIGSIRVAGAITSSFIGAGVNPVDQTFGNADDKVIGGSSSAIHLLIARSADSASRFEAGAFGQMRIPLAVDVTRDQRFRLLT